MDHFLTADVGGTKLAAALFRADGVQVAGLEIPSVRDDGERLFESLAEAFRGLCSDAGLPLSAIRAAAVGIPGIVDAEHGIAVYQNNLPWRDFPLKQRLEGLLPGVPVMVDNDVYMAAWGEYRARGLTGGSFVYVTFSTGISCCTINEGVFLRGAGMAGEVGFSRMDGADRTLEEAVSGIHLEQEGRRLYGEPELTLKTVMDRYYEGDERAVSLVSGAVTALAKSVHQLLLIADPACIALGGGIFNNHPALIEAVRSELGRQLTHPLFAGKEGRIEASLHKGGAGMLGAYYRCTAHQLTV